LLLFAWLAQGVLERQALTLDHDVLVILQSRASPAFQRIAVGVSLLGGVLLWVLLVCVAGCLIWKRCVGVAISLLIAVIGAQLLNDVLKLLFQRPRPTAVLSLLPGQSWSFPSGHAMLSLAFYGFLAYLSLRLLRGRWRITALVGLGLIVLLIGLARLYLGVHYFSDVIAGYAASLIWLESVILGGRLLGVRGPYLNQR